MRTGRSRRARPEQPPALAAPRFTLRAAEVAVGLAFVSLAVVVAGEGLRLGAGWDDSGPGPGFFPFWLAVLLAAGAVAALVEAVRSRRRQPFFEVRQEVTDVLAVGGPVVAAVASMVVLGFYGMTALYVGGFVRWYGRHSWSAAVAAGILTAVALYVGLERGFRIPLPRSLWYGTLLPF